MTSTIRILPYQYIHVLDCNSNVSKLVSGPKTYIRLDHEKVISGKTPRNMIILGNRQYAEILNPVILDSQGTILRDRYGQVKVRRGEREYRFKKNHPEPFPLYPGEELAGELKQLTLVKENSALRIRANREIIEKDKKLTAGEEWLFIGPGTYYPRIGEDPVGIEIAMVIQNGEALKLRAKQDYIDSQNVKRSSGDEWLIKKEGCYQPGVHESVVTIVKPFILTASASIILRATHNFKDIYEVERKAGEEWLVTAEMSSQHILDVHEIFVKNADFIILSKNQYCTIVDPFDPRINRNKLGAKIIKNGESFFFLHPGESLEGGIKSINTLGERDALLVKATEDYTQRRIHNPKLYNQIQEIVKKGKENEEIRLIKNIRNGHIKPVLINQNTELKDYERNYELKEGESLLEFINDITRIPGEQWMEYGPLSYLPPVEVEVLRKVQEIPLDINEGIYVRNIRSGEIRAHIGSTYMLQAYETLWKMDLSSEVRELLTAAKGGEWIDTSRVVKYKVPYNSAVQIYNYKSKKARINFGPKEVILQPDEVLTVNSLSGGKPKRANAIKSLHMMLGPDFTSDIIEVETSDHARLKIKLSYNWHFEVDKNDPKSAEKLFSIKDFIGDMCTIMAARIRSTVAGVNFENFHKSFAKLIRTTIFGLDEKGKVNQKFVIEKNGLNITNVDIQQVQPVDIKTQKSLDETVSLAIEITTKSQEEEARRSSERTKQEAEGELERLNITYQSRAEESRKKLLELEADSIEIKNSGKANAEAKALAEVKKNIIKRQILLNQKLR